jgi:hypothetical protein
MVAASRVVMRCADLREEIGDFAERVMEEYRINM